MTSDSTPFSQFLYVKQKIFVFCCSLCAVHVCVLTSLLSESLACCCARYGFMFFDGIHFGPELVETQAYPLPQVISRHGPSICPLSGFLIKTAKKFKISLFKYIWGIASISPVLLISKMVHMSLITNMKGRTIQNNICSETRYNNQQHLKW